MPANHNSSSDSNSVQKGSLDASLRQVIEAWPRLPEAVKAAIRAMIQAVGQTD